MRVMDYFPDQSVSYVANMSGQDVSQQYPLSNSEFVVSFDNDDQSQPRTNHTPAEWNEIRASFTEVYLRPENSLDDAMRIMAEDHNFHATKSMYKKRIKTWDIFKNLNAAAKEEYAKAAEACASAGMELPRLDARGRPIPWDRVRRRELALRTKRAKIFRSANAPLALRRHASDETDEHASPAGLAVGRRTRRDRTSSNESDGSSVQPLITHLDRPVTPPDATSAPRNFLYLQPTSPSRFIDCILTNIKIFDDWQATQESRLTPSTDSDFSTTPILTPPSGEDSPMMLDVVGTPNRRQPPNLRISTDNVPQITNHEQIIRKILRCHHDGFWHLQFGSVRAAHDDFEQAAGALRDCLSTRPSISLLSALLRLILLVQSYSDAQRRYIELNLSLFVAMTREILGPFNPISQIVQSRVRDESKGAWEIAIWSCAAEVWSKRPSRPVMCALEPRYRLVNALQDQGYLWNANAVGQDLVADYASRLGPANYNTRQAARKLAEIYKKQNLHDSAADLLRQTIQPSILSTGSLEESPTSYSQDEPQAVDRPIPQGRMDSAAVNSLRDLGLVDEEVGNHTEAQECFQRALGGAIELWGVSGAETLHHYERLAKFFRKHSLAIDLTMLEQRYGSQLHRETPSAESPALITV